MSVSDQPVQSAEGDPQAPPTTGVSRRTLVGAAATIATGNVLSRALGLVRETVIAATFGATGQTDAWVVARTVPLILYDLLVGSVISAAFVPVLVQYKDEPRQFWRGLSALLSLAALAFAAVAVLLAAFAEPLVALIAPGFVGPRLPLGTGLMRIALISVVFQGLAGILTSGLYALDRFTLPAFAVAIYNAGVILGVLVLTPVLGIYALAAGLLVGAVGQFALQGAGLRSFWRAYRPRLDLADPAVRRVVRLSGPVSAGMVVSVAGYLIDVNLGSQLPEGSLSAKGYATTLVQFPLGMVGMAASVAVLPTLARFGVGAQENLQHYRETLLFGIKLILLLMLPAFVGLMILGQPAVAVVFEHGRFAAADTLATTRILLAFLPQLPFTGLDLLLINAFYARQDVRTPVLVGVVGTLLYLGVALALIQPLGIVGLALADTVKNTAHALILLAILVRRLPGLELGAGLAAFLPRILVAAGVMGAAVWAAWIPLARVGVLPGFVLAVGLGAGLYATMLHLLRVPEVQALAGVVRTRLDR